MLWVNNNDGSTSKPGLTPDLSSDEGFVRDCVVVFVKDVRIYILYIISDEVEIQSI